MESIIFNYIEAVVKSGFFDIDNSKASDDKSFYKHSRIRNSEWYEKAKIARALLTVEEELEGVLEDFYCDQILQRIFGNKKEVVMHSLPSKKFSLVDVILCYYIKEKHPNIQKVTLVKHVPVDEEWFIETPTPLEGVFVEYSNELRPSKSVIEIEGHRFIF